MQARLADIGRRIDHLYADAQYDIAETKPRMQRRHVEALWQKESVARAIVARRVQRKQEGGLGLR